jgi:hypothetical protein
MRHIGGMIRSHTTAFSDESKVAGNQMVNHMEPCVDCNNKKQEERP